MKYYTEDHEWVEIIGETATVGISQFAIEEYGEVSFIELPDEGDDFIIGDRLCSMETDLYSVELCAPICGSISAVNESLADEPELINESPESKGWICKMVDLDASELDDMMTEDEYYKYLDTIDR
jgi:glycine cleavage system H protein